MVRPTKASWSPLVAICRGSAGKRPLFCVHGAGGNVLNFKAISDRLGTDQPFYGLQAQGVDGRLPPLATVEAMAAQYVEAIRSVVPVGPYRLAGYSGGGVIAFEMAQQLMRDGARVAMVAMIDTLSPDAAAKKISLPEKVWLIRHWTFKFAMQWPQRHSIQKKFRIGDALARQRLLQGEKLTPDLLECYLFGSFIDAQSQYKPLPYSGSVVLFRCSEAYTPYLRAGAKLGWQAHVEGGVRVTEVPGSHVTMMAEPGLSVLMGRVKRELARLDNEAIESLPRILPTDQVS